LFFIDDDLGDEQSYFMQHGNITYSAIVIYFDEHTCVFSNLRERERELIKK